MSKSKPYSSISVKSVEVSVLAQSHAGQACVFGLDVAKFELMGVIRWPDGSFTKPWRIVNPDELLALMGKLRQLHASCPVTVALESSGTYGDALRQAVCDAGIPTRRVSAKAVKDQAETFDGVPSQHDGKDAAIIADLCGRGKSAAWELPKIDAPTGNDDAAIRYWVRRLDGSQRIKQILGGKAEALLARHWPEVTRLVKGTSATLAGALAHWGDPAALAADAQAATKLASVGGHYLKEAKIAALVESARSTAGVRMNAWEQRELKELGEKIVAQRKEIGGCKRQLKKLTRDHDAIVAQTPAVGLTTACVLWTCLGDPRNYDSAGAYRKAMGLNLVEHSSGRFKGQLHLSKRGQRLARKWLYFSALRWMRDPAIRPWVTRKKARDGGKGMRALVGVMRRLALAAWHVPVNGVAFDAARLFPGARAARARAQGRSSR